MPAQPSSRNACSGCLVYLSIDGPAQVTQGGAHVGPGGGKKRGRVGQLALPFPEAAQLRRFWQRRYYDFNVHSEKKLREKLDYMHMNPVREKLAQHPRDWPWSSWTFYERGEGLLAMDEWK